MAAINYVTEEGLERLKSELDHLKSIERPAIARQIAEARDKGDLSENAEYDAAKEAQGILEMKISQLEATVANSRVLDKSKIDISQVQIMNKVKLRNCANKAVMQYQIVAESEANLKEGRISIGTPIAQALLGKKVGEKVEVQVPSGKIKFEILEISI